MKGMHWMNQKPVDCACPSQRETVIYAVWHFGGVFSLFHVDAMGSGTIFCIAMGSKFWAISINEPIEKLMRLNFWRAGNLDSRKFDVAYIQTREVM